MGSTCFDCGATLKAKMQAVWTCSNAACPTGTDKHLCGYCREPSFNPKTGMCANPACRTHKILRNFCPTCQFYSVVTLGGMTFCFNRQCSTNAGWATACPTCVNDSLIQLDGTAVCVKSTCPNLLYQVPWPASIGSRRGLGGAAPAPGQRTSAAPGTTALRRYPVDPDAQTVMPGAPQPAPEAKARPRSETSHLFVGVDPNASTVLLPDAVDEKAETVMAPASDPRLTVLPVGFDENAETVMAPADPPPRPVIKLGVVDEEASTVLAPSGQRPVGRPWAAADNEAETVMTDLSQPHPEQTPPGNPPTRA